jgi:hypothetical protein
MAAESIYKWGGAALILGGVGFLINIVYGDTVFEGFRPTHAGDPMWATIGWIGIVAGILTVFGITALYASMAAEVGMIGFWGYVLSAAAGMVFGPTFGAIFTVAIPLMSASDQKTWDLASGAQPPAGIAVLFIGATILFVVGFAMLGFAAYRARALPAWGSWGLVGVAILALVLTAIRFAVPTLNAVVADLGFIAFFVLSVGLGYRLWASERTVSRPAMAAG